MGGLAIDGFVLVVEVCGRLFQTEPVVYAYPGDPRGRRWRSGEGPFRRIAR
jgi:hypothetical protein